MGEFRSRYLGFKGLHVHVPEIYIYTLLFAWYPCGVEGAAKLLRAQGDDSHGKLLKNKSSTSLSEDYSHPDDHTRQTTDTPGFKPFTNSLSEDYSHPDDHIHVVRQTTDTSGFKPFTNSNSLSEDYSHPDDHTRQTNDTDSKFWVD